MGDYQQGSIVFLSNKGYGFITSTSLAENSFFHAKELKGLPFAELHIGQNVKFKISKNDLGVELVDVNVI